jgi:hypothetical protein
VEDEPWFGDYQPEDVLATGLPSGVTAIEPGEWLPVALWHDDRTGAVLYVYRQRQSESDDQMGHTYEEEVQLLRKHGDEWESAGSGGSSWPDPFSINTEELREAVVVSTGIAGEEDGSDGWIYTVGGLCSPEARSVEVVQDGRQQRYPIDSPLHAFVVGVYVPPNATIRLLDALDRPIHRGHGAPVEWIIRTDDDTHLFPGELA